MLKAIYSEAVYWQLVEHQHILPLYGVADIISSSSPSFLHTVLVSPLMNNGNLSQYLKSECNPDYATMVSFCVYNDNLDNMCTSSYIKLRLPSNTFTLCGPS